MSASMASKSLAKLWVSITYILHTKEQERSGEASYDGEVCRAVQSGGQLPPPGKRNVFFTNVVFDFAGIFLYIGPKFQENRLID